YRKPIGLGKPSPLDRATEAHLKGTELRLFERGLNGDDEHPPSKPKESSSSLKADLLKAVVGSSGTPEDKEKLVQMLTPYLLAIEDPASAMLVANRIGSGEKTTMKDAVELIAVLNSVRGSQPQQSDIGQLASAMTSMLKAGIELSQKNNEANIDPVTILSQQNEIVKSAYEGQLALAREQLKNKDPEAELERIAKYREIFGWGESEDPDLAKQRLLMADQQSQRAFDLERERWRAEFDTRAEARKARSQVELVQTITGTASKLFESPVVKELGRNVGQRLEKTPVGKVIAKTSDARVVAAQAEIRNPSTAKYGFKCPKCNRELQLGQQELDTIRDKQNGKWVCSCGEGYRLQTTDASGHPNGDIATS